MLDTGCWLEWSVNPAFEGILDMLDGLSACAANVLRQTGAEIPIIVE